MTVGRRLLLALTTVFALALAGCSGAAADPDAPVDLSKVTLEIGDQAGIQQAIVESSHVLDDAPYRVEWSQFPAAAPLLEALRAGAVDAGYAGDAPTLNALASSDDIKIVMASRTPDQSGLALLVPADSPITTVADLRGKTVSPTTQGSIGHYLLLQALEESGMTAADVNVSFLSPVDASAALQSRAIDAWATWDPYTAVAENEQGHRVVRDAQGLTPGIGFLSANTDALQDAATRAALTDFVGRFGKAFEWAGANPEENTRIYTELTKRPEEVAGVVARRAVRRPEPLTPEVIAQVQEIADNYRRYEVLTSEVRVAERIDDLTGTP